MALNPEILAQIQAAFEEAVQTLNGSTEVYYNVPENRQLVQQFMLREGVIQQRWTSSFIWQSAILECRKNNLLQDRPPQKSREEITAQRNSALRADGSAQGNAHSHRNPARCTADEKQQAKDWLHRMLHPDEAKAQRESAKVSQAAAAEQEQRQLVASLPVDIPFERYDKAQRAAFKKLTPENIRLVNARHREYVRAHPPVEQEIK